MKHKSQKGSTQEAQKLKQANGTSLTVSSDMDQDT